MVVGVVVFLGAIAGTVYVVATSYSLRSIESTFGVDIPLDNDEIMDKKLYDLGKELFNLVMNIQSTSLQQLVDQYGIPLPTDIMGIDISSIFQYPITQVGEHFNEVIDSITLNTVGNIAQIDFSSYNLPILTRNIDLPVTEALDIVLNSIGGDMSLRILSRDFGIDLAGSNEMLQRFTDLPLESIGNAIDYLKIKYLVDIDTDLFIKLGATELFVMTERFEQVEDPAVESPLSRKYISAVDENGLVFKEMRYRRDGGGLYYVDNGEIETGATYYRYLTFEPYNPAIHTNPTIFFVKAYLDNFVSSDGTNYAPEHDGDFYALNNLYNEGVPVNNVSELTSGTPYYFYNGTDYILAEEYGVNGVATAASKLEEGQTGYIKVREGTSDKAMQLISHKTIKSLSGVTDDILSLNLGDLLDIDLSPTSTDPKIMQSLANTPVNGLSSAINTLTLSDAIDIDGTSPKILQSLASSNITELSDAMNNLTMEEAIDIDENSHIVLQRIASSNINTVSQDITTVLNTLALKELTTIQEYDVYNQVESSATTLLTRQGTTADYLFVTDVLDGNYYYDSGFKMLDATYFADTASYTRYSRRLFEQQLLANAAGSHVLVNGFAEPFDSLNPAHEGLPRFMLLWGYVATGGEMLNDANGFNMVTSSANNIQDVYPVTLDTNYEKSARMLISLGDCSVENMASTFGSLTMAEIINIEADSFFDDAGIRGATPDNLPTAVALRLANSTIGQLADWGNLNLDAVVLAILRNVTVADFFYGLSFDGMNIIFDPTP